MELNVHHHFILKLIGQYHFLVKILMKLFMKYNKQKLIPMMRILISILIIIVIIIINFIHHSNYHNIVMGFVLPQNKSPPSLTWARLKIY